MTEKEDGGGGGGGGVVVDDQKQNAGETSPCPCKCEGRLKTLEDEIQDLKIWKVQVDKFQQILAQVEKLLAVKKASAPAPAAAAATPAQQRPNPCTEAAPPPHIQKVQVPVPAPSPELIAESKPDASPVVELDELPPIDESNGIENVEITPDFFGHFLLGEDDEEPMNHHNMSVQDEDDYEEDDDDDDIEEIQRPSEVEVLIPSSPCGSSRKRRREGDDESDSEDVYSVSDDSDDYTSDSDEEYIPAGKRGRGRGRGTVVEINSGSGPTHSMNVKRGPTQHASSMKREGTQALDSQTRLELIRHCKKRPGDIWECNVCGFMLTSLDNMLLHVKYNHSTSTHTCPFCKVVVLCRSPKDAVMHQVQCNMRPQGAHCRTPSNSFKRLANNNSSTTPPQVKPAPVPLKPAPAPPPARSKPPPMSVDDKVNQFVSELLDVPIPKKSSGSSSSDSKTTKAGGGGRGRKPVAQVKATRSSSRRNCAPPVTVTLSSDEEDSSSSN